MPGPDQAVDLTVVVPSRGRPEAALQLADVCAETGTADTWLLFAVDADDPTLPAYHAALACHPRAVVHAVTEPGGHVRAINAAAISVLGWQSPPDAVAKLDDDHRPRTRGWDAAMLAELRNLGTGIVYGNDLLQGPNLATAVAMTTDIVAALGYMGPPGLTHLFVDNVWVEWGRRAGCLRYLPEVIIEHMHPLAGKAEWDDGHRRVNSPGMWQKDTAAWDIYQRDRLTRDVDTIRELRA